MKDILLLAHFVIFPWEKGNSRFIYLADMMCDRGASVELVTSSFLHSEKEQRTMTAEQRDSVRYKITLLDEPSYSKNVSLKRLRSHKAFSENLAAYLKTRKKPDAVYCAVPSLDAAAVAAKYCKNNGALFIVDIQDLWPEAFKIALPVPVVRDIIFAPMARKADFAYSCADRVVAVSETYAARGMKKNKKCKSPDVVYLGTDKEYFDECAAKTTEDGDGVIAPPDGKVRLAYAGTLGSSYDLPVVFKAMRKLSEETLAGIEFVVMGDGPRRREFEKDAAGLPVVFAGNLAYPEMVRTLTSCDIAVCPIVKGAAQSIINKHMDYAMAGLPVINTQECEEYRELLDRYECGINCACGSADDVCRAIEKLIGDAELRKSMGVNSRRMGEELFDRAAAYAEIVDAVISDAGK